MKGENLLNFALVMLFLAGLGFAGYLMLPSPLASRASAPKLQTVDQIEALQADLRLERSQDVRAVLKTPLEVAKNKNLSQKELDSLPVQDKREDLTRFPKGLKSEQVHFRVIEGGYAVAFGDIILGKVPEGQSGLEEGVYEPGKPSLWPSAEIPYLIEEGVNVQVVQDSLAEFQRETPVRFVAMTPETEDGIVFISTQEHCASLLGKVGGIQPILLSKDCGKTEVLHEIMHALGFVHEHSREERDRYVKVHWENIEEIFLSQFNIVPDALVHNYTGSVFAFDHESIMLYPEHAFSKQPGRLKTLESKTGKPLRPSQGALSKIDKERVYYLYGY